MKMCLLEVERFFQRISSTQGQSKIIWTNQLFQGLLSPKQVGLALGGAPIVLKIPRQSLLTTSRLIISTTIPVLGNEVVVV
jgi:hypothetical protein